MTYNVKLHGDLLEQIASPFIQTLFPNYERVWQIYIGNKGNATRADLPNYPDEKKRQKFSENTYTILESLFLAKKIIDSRSLEIIFENDEEKYFIFINNFILFFTHIGRVRDNLKEAATQLTSINVKEIETSLDEFYQKMHIVVHGKKIPVFVDTKGQFQMPKLCSSRNDLSGWNDSEHTWDNLGDFESNLAQSSLEELFWQIQSKSNAIFGDFYSVIKSELTELCLELKFEYSQGNPSLKENITNQTGTYFLPESSGVCSLNIPKINISSSMYK